MSNRSCHGTSSTGSQTSNALALALGAPPSAAIAKQVASNLAADVDNFGNKTTAGVFGLAWLLPQLEKHGHGELALAVLEGDQYPSIGHMSAQNYTTLCENWYFPSLRIHKACRQVDHSVPYWCADEPELR